VLTGAGIPVYRHAQKDRSAVLAFYDELERWISRPSPAREEDAVLNGEIVLQVLKDLSSLVGNISGLASQMRLWPEPLPQPIEFYHPRVRVENGCQRELRSEARHGPHVGVPAKEGRDAFLQRRFRSRR
jgi:hypothetical protein